MFVDRSSHAPQNVLGYKVGLSKDGRMLISVLDEAADVHRDIVVRSLADQLGEFELFENSGSLRVSWNRGVLTIGTSDGEFGTIHCDTEAMAFVGSSESMKLVDYYKPELVIIATAVTDVVTALGPTAALTSLREPDTVTPDVAHPILYPDPGDGGLMGGNCHGMTHTGSGYNFLRSIAISLATVAANQNCNNQWCWGCCELDAPNCTCAAGDTFCICIRKGISCGAEDVDF